MRHSADEGTLGLVLNRQTTTSVKELWERMDQHDCRCDAKLSLGGPCEGPLMALHTDATTAEIEVLPGLYFTASGDQLRSLVTGDGSNVRFFFGYAGWGAGPVGNGVAGWRCAPNRPGCGTFSPSRPNCGNARSAKRPAGKSSSAADQGCARRSVDELTSTQHVS